MITGRLWDLHFEITLETDTYKKRTAIFHELFLNHDLQKLQDYYDLYKDLYKGSIEWDVKFDILLDRLKVIGK